MKPNTNSNQDLAQQKPYSLNDLNKYFSVEVEEQIDLLTNEEVDEGHRVILYNDDHNTFDYVITTLVELCEHKVLQAEQCAYIVHNHGKCCVKEGSEKKMLNICREMRRRGLSAVVES